jgi:hypothetical protein
MGLMSTHADGYRPPFIATVGLIPASRHDNPPPRWCTGIAARGDRISGNDFEQLRLARSEAAFQSGILQKFFALPLHIPRQSPALFYHECCKRRGILINDLLEQALLGTMALLTTCILFPAGHPGGHIRHDPLTCVTVFIYSLSLSEKSFIPQPKCQPVPVVSCHYPPFPHYCE